jgi:YARHG domain
MNAMSISKRLALFTVLAVGAIGPATAGCYESGVDCTDDHKIPSSVLHTLSCDALWTIRNSIYNEHGYCFKTAKAKSVFDNSDCSVHNASNLDFNSYEQTNIDRIASVEEEMGCN